VVDWATPAFFLWVDIVVCLTTAFDDLVIFMLPDAIGFGDAADIWAPATDGVMMSAASARPASDLNMGNYLRHLGLHQIPDFKPQRHR
jgi:hypothetical protein